MQTVNTYYKNYRTLKKFVNEYQDVLLDPNNRSVLVQVFSGIVNQDFLASLSKQIKQLIPRAQIIGTTTNGEIMNGLISGLNVVLSFSVFQCSDVKLIFAEKGNITDYELGRSLASKLDTDNAKVLILFSTGLTVNPHRLLTGLQSESSLPVAGGSAGDNLMNKQCFVFSNEDITDCGVAGAVLTGENLTVVRHSHLGWQPIGKEMTITHSEDSRVYTIDDMPAYQVYQRYLGANKEFNILNGIEFPLIIYKHGLEIGRSPFFRYDDDSLAFFGDIPPGEKVRFSFGHISLILEQIETLLETIRQQPVESIFVYSCVARRSFLQESAQIETLPLQDIAPTAGFFTSGEFFHIDNNNHLLNNTMTTVAISEPGSVKKTSTSKRAAVQRPKSIPGQANVPVDNVTTRSIGILKALTCLVNTVTNELNEKTVQLQTANEQLQFTSTHDALTGLYNRGYFEQQLIDLKAASPGIIICDVDGLKLINDTFGHNMGDAILKAAARILKSVAKPDDVVARIGGDEFSILLSNSCVSEVEDFCYRLRYTIDQYNLVNPAVPLSMSIGFACSENELTGTSMLFKDADDKMYREKLHRNQSAHSDLVQTLVRTLEARDIVTEEHSHRLQDLLVAFALQVGVSQSSMADIRLLARFHDIGKVGIADQVLFKPGPLTAEERKEMQRHCEIGHRIARSSSDLHPIAEWILKHHEWWNGKGYPLGLKGTNIPLECRLLAIVDAYDAMVSDRPYRKAMNIQTALDELKRCAGVQFDPNLVNVFMGMMAKIECSIL